MNDVERGQRLKELRRNAGLLQRHVGAEFDIDKASVSSWESGQTSPDRRKLARLDELYEANGEVLAMYGVTPPDDGDARLDLLRQAVVTIGEALEVVMTGVEMDVQEDLDELRLALRSAIEAVQ
ncbi:MAG: helix-turn-helix transcriptional regulator [Actinomycetota bacterium]